MNKKIKFLLLIIILIAAILRLWKLGMVPPSPDWDEAALGYNAYSIIETGRDEYGKFLPIIIRSFDDYKPALYMYLIIPFIKLFDVTVVAVRLPSAILGILTVLGTFYIVKELFPKGIAISNKIRLSTHFVGLTSSFLLAISPWHIQFSRIAFESNAGVAFNLFAVLFFLKGLKKPFYFFFSISLMALNLYMYQSEKVFVPLLFIVLVFIFRNELFKLPRKALIMPIVLGLIIALPLIFYTTTNKEAFARAKGVSVFSDTTPFLKDNALKLLRDRQNGDILGLIIDNRRFVYVKAIIAGYISHFDFNWLFIGGDIARHHAPSMGLLYLWELPFLLVGIYKVFFDPDNKKAKLLLFSWFLIVPIPASITNGVPHAVRTLNFLPLFQIFTAVGLTYSIVLLLSSTKNYLKPIIFCLCSIIIIFNICYYLNQYFVQLNYFTSQDWQYGYKEAVTEVSKIEKNYKKIIVSNKPYLDQSYIFFLFYLKYNPALYQKESQAASGGFRENHIFGKYEFRPINWEEELPEKNTLYIGMPEEFPKDYNTLQTISFLDGKQAIKIITK